VACCVVVRYTKFLVTSIYKAKSLPAMDYNLNGTVRDANLPPFSDL
jgi:hypothetical protein